ncbi:MAG: VOC family protein [Chloroflexales bacterium]|nr:VOC family protein [Chloroflexales bacterium]
MPKEWPEILPCVQMRITRPTAQFDRVIAFYRDGLGLPVIFSYADDHDYDGMMFGLPGRDYHLEITQYKGDGTCPRPSPDTLLVFYIPDLGARDQAVARLQAMGYHPVAPRNPYWASHGMTIPDPDGWHIVLMNTPGFGEDIV